MKKSYLYIGAVLFLNFNLFSQSVGNSKKQLNSGSSSTSSSRKSSSSSSNYASDIDFFIGMFQTFGFITYGVLVGDYENENNLSNNLNSHPFSARGRGNYVASDTISKINFRIDIENKYLMANNSVSGNHLDLKIHPSKYFYFSTDWYQLSEKNIFTNKQDQLSLYFFNFAYDRIRLENFNIGWTMGASYVANDVKRGGFSYGINGEYFLDANMSIQVDAKLSIINSIPANAFALKLKYFKNNYFGTVAYENLQIASPKYNFIRLGAGIYF